MKMYAEIINEKTKQCNVGTGTDTEFYKSIGMEEMDVEQAYNGDWYLKGYAPQKPLDEARQEKLTELNNYFSQQEQTASLKSSLGFEIDANETANRNIDGLIKALQAGQVQEPVMFCDKNNEIQPVTLANLETMQLEVILNGQLLYQKKWLVRNKINACETVEELEAINVEVEFNAQS